MHSKIFKPLLNFAFSPQSFDQTKLIAFNESLEASSVALAGKRFAVDAMEIRTLAENVMSSTREIKNKIDEIQHAINLYEFQVDDEPFLLSADESKVAQAPKSYI
jgi:hypothetical protein